jgi:hypothetical protein
MNAGLSVRLLDEGDLPWVNVILHGEWCVVVGRTVLLSDRSDFGGVIRPVVVMGQKRPGSVDLWNPVHEWEIPLSRRFDKKKVGKLVLAPSLQVRSNGLGPPAPGRFMTWR